MPTLYEILKKWVKKSEPKKDAPCPCELQIYNPLQARIGCAVTVDDVDLKRIGFFVQGVRELTVLLGGKSYPIAEYLLVATPLEGEAMEVRLRVTPAGKDDSGGLGYRILILHQWDSLAYCDGLLEAVKDPTKIFKIDNDSLNFHAEFFRVNDVGDSFKATCKSITAKEYCVQTSEIEFWDFSRMTHIDSVEMEQFLLVEMNTDNGWFQLLGPPRGYEISPDRVSLA